MPVREGGSYAADEKTGAVTRTGGTDQPDAHRLVEADPIAEVPTAPAAPELPPAEASTIDHPEA